MAGYVSIRLCHCLPELSFWQVALGETLRGFVCWQTRKLEILSCKTSSIRNSSSKVSAGHEHVALSENCVPEIILKLVVRFETCENFGVQPSLWRSHAFWGSTQFDHVGSQEPHVYPTALESCLIEEEVSPLPSPQEFLRRRSWQ